LEGILFLILLAWLFRKAKKPAVKNGKRKVNASEAASAKKTRKKAEPVLEKEIEQAVPAFQPLSEGQSHMAFTQDVHGCLSDREEYMGSMHADTSEGEDACDPLLAHERREFIDPESVYAAEIGREPLLDLSARGIFQGVVMSEILARPKKRSVRRF